MSKPSQDLTVKELLEKIDQLEAAVGALSKKLDALTRQEKDHGEITDEHLKLLSRVQKTHHIALCNAFDRIQNIEVKLFPNLAADMLQVKNILGDGDDKVQNPLDQRPRE
jgi:hypothetical protein